MQANVTTTVSSPLSGMDEVPTTLRNLGPSPIYLGPSNTNVSNGFPLYPGEAVCVIPGVDNMYAISQSGICTLAVLVNASGIVK